MPGFLPRPFLLIVGLVGPFASRLSLTPKSPRAPVTTGCINLILGLAAREPEDSVVARITRPDIDGRERLRAFVHEARNPAVELSDLLLP